MDQWIQEQFSRTLSNVEETCREINATQYESRRPFFMLKPKVMPDGNQWCALYGENLQEGVAGFGDTPEKAAIQFDIEWLNSKIEYRAAR